MGRRWLMLSRTGMLRALHRDIERVFDTSRKPPLYRSSRALSFGAAKRNGPCKSWSRHLESGLGLEPSEPNLIQRRDQSNCSGQASGLIRPVPSRLGSPGRHHGCTIGHKVAAAYPRVSRKWLPAERSGAERSGDKK